MAERDRRHGRRLSQRDRGGRAPKRSGAGSACRKRRRSRYWACSPSRVVLSLFEATVATWAISFLSLVDFDTFLSSWVTASTAASIPRLSPIGLAPAVTFLSPSR